MFFKSSTFKFSPLRSLLPALLFLAAGSSALAADCKTTLVSGPPIWPPFIKAETDGKPREGIAIEFVGKIFSNIRVPFVLDEAKPWARVLKELEAGDLDFAMAIFNTPERREKFAFTEPWLSDDYAVITYKGREFSYGSVADLDGKTGAVYHGMRFPPPLDQAIAGNDNIVAVTDAMLLHKMLKLGRVDFVVASIPTFMQLLPEGTEPSEFTVLGSSTVPIPVYMAFSRASPCVSLLDAVNAQIREHRGEISDTIYDGVVTN